jgi:hypothetical protein
VRVSLSVRLFSSSGLGLCSIAVLVMIDCRMWLVKERGDRGLNEVSQGLRVPSVHAVVSGFVRFSCSKRLQAGREVQTAVAGYLLTE